MTGIPRGRSIFIFPGVLFLLFLFPSPSLLFFIVFVPSKRIQHHYIIYEIFVRLSFGITRQA